jgi:hypothetical protein
MAGNIRQFLSSFTKDLARPNRFEVFIPGEVSERLRFRCENAELPGKTFATAELKIGANPTEKYPYHVAFNDLNLTFIVSDDMIEKQFFEQWMEQINPSDTYNYEYRTTYAKDIEIYQYGVDGKRIYAVRLKDAFPISTNQLDLDWSADGHHKLSVTMAYTSWQKID